MNVEEDRGYVSQSITNSFPDVQTRVRFLNRFYQCLLYGQLPHKAKKLVVHGTSDSGKTSWANVFKGIILKTKIASVTKEAVFGLNMLEDDTKLVFIDEWGPKTMPANTAKCLLQGGWTTQSVKFGKGRNLNNKAGMYLTCNNLPDFGDDQEHINKRIETFQATPHPALEAEAAEWMEKKRYEVSYVAHLRGKSPF